MKLGKWEPGLRTWHAYETSARLESAVCRDSSKFVSITNLDMVNVFCPSRNEHDVDASPINFINQPQNIKSISSINESLAN